MSASVISGIGELRIDQYDAVEPDGTSSLQVKHDSEQKHKAGNSEIDPLHILQRALVVANMVEDDERPDHRRDNRANTVESLREVDTNLRVLWRTADGDVWVRSGFEATKAITDDENGRAEASERAVEDTWPCDKRADAVQAQSPDERCFVAVMAQNPVGVAERSQRIRAEVGCLQTRRACTGDVQDVLKMFVQSVEKTI